MAEIEERKINFKRRSKTLKKIFDTRRLVKKTENFRRRQLEEKEKQEKFLEEQKKFQDKLEK